MMGGNKEMTKTELQEKIAHLESELIEVREQVSALPERVGGMFMPEFGEEYRYISSESTVHVTKWGGDSIDRERYAIGNCFPTEKAADDAVRALKLIQKARESQYGFVPDWENLAQNKYVLYFDMGDIRIMQYISWNIAPIFGFWEDESACYQFVLENREELLWFFTEYQV